MKQTIKFPIAISCTFIWVGFIVAISFMEAWIKFQAPGITLPLGLGIGRLVFSTLNKMEWVMAIAILVSLFRGNIELFSWKNATLLVPIVILLAQSVWALPALDARAQLYINGTPPPPSILHFGYIAMETAKVICLIFFGARLLK